jgi:hypothetical protein
VADISAEIRGSYRLHDAYIIEFLGIVNVVSPWIAGNVKVTDEIDVFSHGPYYVAFHDLHVVDVVKELARGRIHPSADLDSPFGVVGLVVGVVNLAVAQLDHQYYAGFFRQLDYTQQTFRRVVYAFFIGKPAAGAGKADQIRDTV